MYVITTDPTELFTTKEAISKLGFKCDDANLDMIPKTYVECDLETVKANQELIDWLENIDDVDAVYHNMTTPD